MSNIEELGFNEPHQYDIEELIEVKKKQDAANAKIQIVDKFTGEVRRFRSMSNVGSFQDHTVVIEPSVTDTSDYEPLETTIERCSRSGYLREYMEREKILDKSNALDEDPNDFDFEPSPVETPGFDLTDAKELETQMIDNLKGTPGSEASEGDAISEPASADASPSEPSAPAE